MSPEHDIPSLPLHEADNLTAEDMKPTWRGWIHAGIFPVTVVAGVILLIVADGAAAKWSSAVFVASSMLLFGNSALYHRFNWKPRTKLILKRIDHANIFLLIQKTRNAMPRIAPPQIRLSSSTESDGGSASTAIGVYDPAISRKMLA